MSCSINLTGVSVWLKSRNCRVNSSSRRISLFDYHNPFCYVLDNKNNSAKSWLGCNNLVIYVPVEKKINGGDNRWQDNLLHVIRLRHSFDNLFYQWEFCVDLRVGPNCVFLPSRWIIKLETCLTNILMAGWTHQHTHRLPIPFF